jgi:hypothetical protein
MGAGLVNEDVFEDNTTVNCSALISVVMDDSNCDEDIIMVEDELVEKYFVDHDTNADTISRKECINGENQVLEMVSNVAVGVISAEEITFFEHDLIIHDDALYFEDTSDSGLRSNIGNLWNPSIWYHHFNESLCESIESVWFESLEKWSGEDENHPLLPVVLYSSNFSPPDYIDVPFNGIDGTSGDKIELSYPINPSHHHYQNLLTKSYTTNKSFVSWKNGEFSSICHDELLIHFHFGINPSIGLIKLDTFIGEVICFYLWFKENYKELFINISVYGLSYISGADLGISLMGFLLSYFWITCSCRISPSSHDSYPCAEMLGGEQFDFHESLPKHVQQDMSIKSMITSCNYEKTKAYAYGETLKKPINGEMIQKIGGGEDWSTV